ncbi:MAG: hypothetical protein LBG27_04190 [Spirochaetaceae bacterium]|jgi:hypothetical protein|nr:hypothetical protein [Spirochaetaceae bacterium]
MKKILFVFGLLVMGWGLFAQNISFGGHLAANFENVMPTFELGINFSRVDVLAGVSFWLYQDEVSYDNYQNFNVDSKVEERWFRIFAGLAPKVAATEKLTLSFPLLAKIQFRDDAFSFEDDRTYSTSSPQKVAYFGYGIDFGARVHYALTKRWNIYGGTIMNVLFISHNKYTYWKNSPDDTYTRQNNTMSWFTDGLVEMGARVTF